MAHVFPFKGVVPQTDSVGRVATPPYDVLSRDEALALVGDNPDSFLHVTRSEIDLPPEMDPYSDTVYQTARDTYRAMKKNGLLVADDEASFHVYRLTLGDHSQTGVVVAAAVDDYDAGVIKKHEKTRPLKEDDRTRHIMAVGAQTGAVFLTFRGTESVHRVVADTVADAPIRRFVAEDGVEHALWRVRPSRVAELKRAFADIPALYIADGHHRAASASRVRNECRARNPNHVGDEAYNRFLAVAFPADELRILAYHRVVSDLGGLTREEFLACVAQVAQLVEPASPTPDAPGRCAMFLAGRWYGLRFKVDPALLPPVDRLDVSLLQNLILSPILDIADPRSSERIDFVGGIRGVGELEQRVRSGEMAVAFSLFPTRIEQLLAISDAGEVMPPKSTWFEPKLRDGLVVHEI